MAWMIYGANGYTGRLIAEEACRRGMAPFLAGRSAQRVGPLAERLHCLSRVFDLRERAAIAEHLAGLELVLNCAGPFSATAEPMIEACLAARVHYLDITGEIDAICAAADRDQAARDAGVMLVPGVGFDVVPSDCLAAMLARRLPGARLLQLAFVGLQTVSPGTAKTMLEAVPRGGRVRIGGRIRWVPVAWKTLDVPFPGGPRLAVTVPWGDVASAWYSTRIDDIEVYLAMPPAQIGWLRRLRFLLPLVRLPPIRALLRWGIDKLVAGPSACERQDARSLFWGRATHPNGTSIEATLSGPGGYELTVHAALACVGKVLAGDVRTGFNTPSGAFGPEFILTLPQIDVRWE
jgi:short subunit dehydrogenase-like uncharacterized protein